MVKEDILIPMEGSLKELGNLEKEKEKVKSMIKMKNLSGTGTMINPSRK